MEFLRWDQIAKRLGLGSRTALYRWIKEHPDFPESIDIGTKKPMKRWLKPEIEAWMWRRLRPFAPESKKTPKRPLQTDSD